MSDFRIVKLLDPITVTNVNGGLAPKGAFNLASTYAVGDEVSYSGSSYLLYTLTVAGTLPTDTTKWSVLAAQGNTGPQGPTGPTGTSDRNYIQAFSLASSVAVPHNLAKYPAVQVFDSSLSQCEGTVIHTDINNLTITFTASFSGTVTCN